MQPASDPPEGQLPVTPIGFRVLLSPCAMWIFIPGMELELTYHLLNHTLIF